MHRKFSKDGLAVISVSVDEAKDHKEALQMLKEYGADFTNLLLDEETPYWQEKLRFIGPPCLYVFNRQGRWTQFHSDEDVIDYDKVDRLIESHLKESR